MKRKFSIPFLMFYIFGAVFLFILLIAIVPVFGMQNDWIVIPLMLISLLFVLWIALVPMLSPLILRNSAYKKLARNGFNIQREYKNLTYSLLIDITGGKVAKIYSFNPSTPYIIDAGQIQKIWIYEDKEPICNRVGVIGVRFVVCNNVEIFDLYNQSTGRARGKVYLDSNHPRVIEARQTAHKIACELNDSWKFAHSRYRI